MNNTIYVSRHLSSAKFYNEFLKKWENVKEYHNEEHPIILDFSNTQKVEPLCLANLLSLGNSIQAQTEIPVKIYIPDTVEGGNLKFYLWKMGFLANSKIIKERDTERVIFDYVASPYGGAEGTAIDPICGTVYFESGMKEADIEISVSDYLSPFRTMYLKEFETNERENIIANFLAETVKNCVVHGNSDAYVAIHGRYSDHRIYISISDCGQGFLSSWIAKKKYYEEKIMKGITLTPCEEKDYKQILLTEQKYINHEPANEYEAMICGIYKRKQSKVYGLYNVIRKILEIGEEYIKQIDDDKNGAIVRIHSNNTQIILTDRVLENLKNGELEKTYNFWEYNVRENRDFAGVHIEIEIPFAWKGERYV